MNNSPYCPNISVCAASHIIMFEISSVDNSMYSETYSNVIIGPFSVLLFTDNPMNSPLSNTAALKKKIPIICHLLFCVILYLKVFNPTKLYRNQLCASNQFSYTKRQFSILQYFLDFSIFKLLCKINFHLCPTLLLVFLLCFLILPYLYLQSPGVLPFSP